MTFNKDYYKNNKQDKDRLGLLFYSNIIKNYFTPKNFLDYGCGTGFLLKKVSRINSINKTYGFEVNNYARIQAKKNSSKSLIINNLRKIKENSIDIITCLHVIEHIKDNELKKIFLLFKHILKSEGSIMLATPAKNGLGHKIKKRKWIGYRDKTHINMKNFNEWKIFFYKNNFKIIKSSSDGLWDFPYNMKKNNFLIFKVIITMIFQIFTGKLFLKYSEGESFIFLLKSK